MHFPVKEKMWVVNILVLLALWLLTLMLEKFNSNISREQLRYAHCLMGFGFMCLIASEILNVVRKSKGKKPGG